jgi:ribosomal protein L7/L12
MEKLIILRRLEMLIGLCETTEPDIPSDAKLFSGHAISVQEMIKEVRDLHTGRQSIDQDSERDLMINIMRRANRLWKTMNRIQNGEKVYKVVLEDELEDFIMKGQKINAIKHYRRVMKEQIGEEPSLRASKDYIDSLQHDLKYE